MADLKRKQLEIDYGLTFNTEHGEKVVNDLVRHSGMLSPLLPTGDATSALWFREGQKSIVCRVLEFKGIKEKDIEYIIKGANND